MIPRHCAAGLLGGALTQVLACVSYPLPLPGIVVVHGDDSAADSTAATDSAGDSDTDSAGDSATETRPAPPPAMVLVPASTFEMGCTPSQTPCDEEEVETAAHTVTLTHDYLVGVTEVTQAQFETVMGYNPSHNAGCGCDCPVENMTWYEAAAYTNALSDAAGLEECYTCSGSGGAVACADGPNPYDCAGYRMLTEAEWEGAARCGTDLVYAGSDLIAEVGWTDAPDAQNDHTRAAAMLAANACGIYDMSGNVWEMLTDGRADKYPEGAGTDPTVPGDPGWWRQMRGGDFHWPAFMAQVSYRSSVIEGEGGKSGGFRIGMALAVR